MVDAVVPAVVITNIDVSKIPVELAEDVAPAEVVSRVVFFVEVEPSEVLVAEVVPRV